MFDDDRLIRLTVAITREQRFELAKRAGDGVPMAKVARGAHRGADSGAQDNGSRGGGAVTAAERRTAAAERMRTDAVTRSERTRVETDRRLAGVLRKHHLTRARELIELLTEWQEAGT